MAVEADLPAAPSSVEQAFRPAFDEITRRSGAAASLVSAETTFFPRTPDGPTGGFERAGQEHVLVSMATSALAPRLLDPERPCLRVYGAFPTRQDAVDHADVVRAVDVACSLVLLRRGEWALLPQSEASRDDRAENARRTAARVDAHAAALAEAARAFDACVAERRAAQPLAAAAAPPSEEQRAEAEAEEVVYGSLRRLRAGAEVRGQNAAVLCVARDTGAAASDPAGREPAVCVLGCFESTSEADAWCRNVGSRRVTDHDLLVVPTCEWISVNDPPSAQKSHYRVDELQRIMDASDRNPEAVREYKEWKAKQDAAAEAQRSALPPPAEGDDEAEKGVVV